MTSHFLDEFTDEIAVTDARSDDTAYMKYSTDDEIAFHNRTKRYYRSSPKLVDEALCQDALGKTSAV